METKFTPGPWEMVSLSGYGSPFSIRMAYHSDNPNAPPTHYGVQSVRTWGDARLIAAAPDLFEALRCCLGYLTGNMDGDMDLGDPVEMARAALLKASDGGA